MRKFSIMHKITQRPAPRNDSEAGFALLTVLVILCAVSILGGAMMSTTTTQLRQVGVQAADAQAFYRAEAMVKYAVEHLEQNGFTPSHQAVVEATVQPPSLLTGLFSAAAKASPSTLQDWLVEFPREFLQFPGDDERRIAVAAISPALGLYAVRAVGVSGVSTRTVTLGVRISGSSYFSKFLNRYAIVGGEGSEVQALSENNIFDARTIWSPNLVYGESGAGSGKGKGNGVGQITGQITVVNDDANTSHIDIDAVDGLVEDNLSDIPSWSGGAWLISGELTDEGSPHEHDGDAYTTGDLILGTEGSKFKSSAVQMANQIKQNGAVTEDFLNDAEDLASGEEVVLAVQNLFVTDNLVIHGNVTINVEGNIWVGGTVHSLGHLTINAKNMFICDSGKGGKSIDKITDLTSPAAGNKLVLHNKGSVLIGSGELNTNIIARDDLLFLGPHPRGIVYTPETASLMSPVALSGEHVPFAGLVIGERRVNLIGGVTAGNDPGNLQIHHDNLPQWLRRSRIAERLIWEEGPNGRVFEFLSDFPAEEG